MRDGASGTVTEVAALLRERNMIDARISAITNRPMVAGHLGEWLASQLFEIDLEPSAAAKAIDGRFATGPLAGKTVNIKWYGKREGMLDMSSSDVLDYYLVFTGPKAAATTSTGGIRPMRIDACYLFEARGLLARQLERGVKVGIASSVLAAEWAAAEVYPEPNSPLLEIDDEAVALLRAFGD
jgi:hypothetical protein